MALQVFYADGSALLQSANNLSDLLAAATARTNLGLGTAATSASSAFEAALGNPGSNGYILSSTTGGSRSWIAPASGGATWISKTGAYTAASGDQIQSDTTSAPFTINLPATPSANAVVTVADMNSTWATNNLTVGRNGSTIRGVSEDLVCNASGRMVILIYSGSTWNVFITSTASANVASAAAVSGTVVTLTGSTTWTVPAGVYNLAQVLVVGGGASGGWYLGGGGGGGEVILSQNYPVYPGQLIPVVIGAGGTAKTSTGAGNAGGTSTFGALSATGGGGGGNAGTVKGQNGSNGGGGGGGGGVATYVGGGTATSVRGYNGGDGYTPAYNGGGGGGAGAAGVTGLVGAGGAGGSGFPSTITGSLVYYGGGGGGCGYPGTSTVGAGGAGGGGAGSQGSGTGVLSAAVSGTANTGGGGGAGSTADNVNGTTSGAGGTGVVIIRY